MTELFFPLIFIKPTIPILIIFYPHLDFSNPTKKFPFNILFLNYFLYRFLYPFNFNFNFSLILIFIFPINYYY